MSFTLTAADRQSYWDSFYSRQDALLPSLPSQFAVFSASDFIGVDGVVEFGCGNGRDSEFLGLNGFPVLALDGSSEAIELCRERSKSPQVRYENRTVDASAQALEDFLVGKQRVAVYARFFLHAIDASTESAFLQLLSAVLPVGSLVYLEYRTTEDALVEKKFGQHYRRFIDHAQLLGNLTALGFSVAYQVQGRGFAKYRDEDALVGRCVAVKERP